MKILLNGVLFLLVSLRLAAAVLPSAASAVVADTLQKELRAVRVTDSNKKSYRSAFAGTQRLEAGQIRSLPVLLGEADVLRALRLLPGVQSVGEGNSGIYVRGGSAGHNLFLLDEMEILNPSHLMGLFSVFNPMTVGYLDVYKGNAPVQIQGHLASTVSVSSSFAKAGEQEVEGNWGTIHASGAYRYTSSSRRFRFVTGYRRSYLETLGWAASSVLEDASNYFKNNGYSFDDFNGLAVFAPDTTLQFSLGWYAGKDAFHFLNEEMSYNATSSWGNNALILKMDKQFSPDRSFHSSLNFNETFSTLRGKMIDNSLDFLSTLRHFDWKNRMDLQLNNHFLQIGLEAFYEQSTPLRMYLGYNADTTTRNQHFANAGVVAYTGDQFRSNSGKMLWYTGIRFSANAPLGPYSYGEYKLGRNEPGKIWLNASPVVSFSRFLKNRRAIKGSFSINEQKVHLASLSSIPLPFDLWATASPGLKPETGHQLTLGYYDENTWAWSVEIYGKKMQNQLLFNVITDNTDSKGFEDQFFPGKGYAYGLDLALDRQWEQHSLHLRYSYARSFRTFEKVNKGEWFNDKNDRPHDLNVQWNYKTHGSWTFHALWTYASGCNINLPQGRWWMSGLVMNDYGQFNGFRLPAYHRLDLSADWNLHPKRLAESVLNFSIVNLYNRSNPYFAYFRTFMGSSKYDLSVRSYQISLFPILPSVSWRFKF